MTRRTEEEIEKYWSSYPMSPEPIPKELKLLVREDLKKVWYHLRFETFRTNLRVNWASLDTERSCLWNNIGRVLPRDLEYMCNKPVPFYWLQSAQALDNTGKLCETPKIIFATIYEEWYRCYNNDPSIEFGHFFANPIRVTGSGPSTVRGVLEAHRSICAQASALMMQGNGRADNIIEIAPSDVQHYKLKPTYRAIAIILDNFDSLRSLRVEPEEDGFISLRKMARTQTVLLARTGMEQGLSAPVSFQSLQAQTLPLERPDITAEEIDVVRVSLETAVCFIVDFETREDKVNVNEKITPVDPSLAPS